MVTFSDTMGLLLCFFIALVSMSEIRRDRFHQAVDSIHRAFGGVGRPRDGISARPEKNSLLDRLLALGANPTAPEPDDSIEALRRSIRVIRHAKGLEIVVSGETCFDPVSATLKSEAKEMIAKVADLLHGYDTKLVVRGHAEQLPLPPDAMYRNGRDLSYARAAAVADELQQRGIRGARLSVVATGDTEPLIKQANSDSEHALNRRVQILVTEDLADDIAEGEPVSSFQESSSGQ
jgi:chemotaxis protein MotB